MESSKQATFPAGILTPIVQYFDALFEEDDLDRLESLEFARAVLQQGRKYLLEKRLKENQVCDLLDVAEYLTNSCEAYMQRGAW